MLVKLLNGDLLTIDDSNDTVEKIVHAILQFVHTPTHNNIHIHLVSEGISEAERELGIAFYAIFDTRQIVHVQNIFGSIAACNDNTDWLQTCVNADILNAVLNAKWDWTECIDILSNPHPLVVDAILNNERAYKNIFVSTNSSDTLLDFLFHQHPDLVSYSNLLRNRNRRAVLYAFDSGRIHYTDVVHHIDNLCSMHGNDEEIITHVLTVLEQQSNKDFWPLAELLSTPHDYLASKLVSIIENMSDLCRNWCHRYLLEFGRNTQLVMSAIHGVQKENIPDRIWANPCASEWILENIEHNNIHMLAKNPNDRVVDYVLSHIVGDDDTCDITKMIPYVLANSNPRMVKKLIEWLPYHNEAYTHPEFRIFARKNRNREFVLFMWRNMKNATCISNAQMLEHLSAWPDIHVVFD